MTMPGFTADRALDDPRAHYRARPASAAMGRSGSNIAPAFDVHIYTGHCGCYADDWWGWSCLCIEY